jgi:hypothetical protein
MSDVDEDDDDGNGREWRATMFRIDSLCRELRQISDANRAVIKNLILKN